MAEPKNHHLVKLISTVVVGWFEETKAHLVVYISGSLKRGGAVIFLLDIWYWKLVSALKIFKSTYECQWTTGYREWQLLRMNWIQEKGWCLLMNLWEELAPIGVNRQAAHQPPIGVNRQPGHLVVGTVSRSQNWCNSSTRSSYLTRYGRDARIGFGMVNTVGKSPVNVDSRPSGKVAADTFFSH